MSSTSAPPRSNPLWAPLAIAAACAGIGVTLAIFAALRALEAQGYSESGFERLRFFLWRDALRDGCRSGAEVGAVLAVIWAVFAALARRAFGDWDRERLVEAITPRAFVVLNAVFALGGEAVGAALLYRHRGWLGRRDVALLVVLALGAVALIARARARVRSEPDSSSRVADALRLICILPFALGWLVLRSATWASSRSLAPLAADAVVFVVGVVLWMWSRARMVRRLDGEQPRRWTGPIGAAGALSGPVIVGALGFGWLEPTLGAPAIERGDGVNLLVIAIDTLRSDCVSFDGLNARGR